MPYSEKLADRIREALADQPDVKEKKMFGGIAFMVNEKMCVTAGDKGMMCRIDPDLHEVEVERPGVSTVVMRNREYKGWIRVTEESVRTKKQLEHFIGLALDFNNQAASSKKKKRTVKK